MTPLKRRACEADLGDGPQDSAEVTAQDTTKIKSFTGNAKDEPESVISSVVPTVSRRIHMNHEDGGAKRQMVAAASTKVPAHGFGQGDATLNELKDTSIDTGARFNRRRPSKKPPIETLPCEVWLRILGFSVFSDSSRLAKEYSFIKDTVFPLLSFVYFDSETPTSYWSDDNDSHEVSFGRVQEIVMDCLICNVSEDDTFSMPGWFRIKNFAKFLSGFKNLKHVLIGKGEGETRAEILTRLGLAGNPGDGYEYTEAMAADVNHPYEPSDDFTARVYQALLEQLSNGYEQGILSKDLYFHGLPSQHAENKSWTPGVAQCNGKNCLLCQRICRHFPVRQVLSLCGKSDLYFPQEIGTIRPSIRLKWIYKRPDGGSAVLIANQKELWKGLIATYTYIVDRSGRNLIHFHGSVLDAMAKLKEYGCDPGCIALKEAFPTDISRKAIARMAYAKLRQIGFEMDEHDFAAVVPY